MEREPLQEAIDGWLADGPLSLEDLADRAVNAGLVPAGMDDEGFGPEDHVDRLMETSDAYWTANFDAGREVVVLTSTVIDTGMTFTHRATEEELNREAISEPPDLSVLLWDVHGGLPLDDGGRLDVDYTFDGSGRLSGPEGWIDRAAPGDVLAFTRTDRIVSVSVVDEEELGDGAAEIEALRDAARRWIGDGRGEEEVPVVMEAMARNPQLFRRPVPPVSELLAAAGLERRGHEWGWADEEWQTRQERFKRHDESIRHMYGFDACCDRAFDRAEAAWHSYVATGGEIDGRALADDLAHGAVAQAYVHVNAGTPGLVASFARDAADATSGRHAAPALTLLGLAHARDGRPHEAVDALEAAVRADGDFDLAASSLAELEMNRGNLSRAHSLAVLHDDTDPGFVEWIESERSRQAELRPSAGRNDPCPCGSGKKFKKCCAGDGPLALAQRLPLVLQRMAHFATGPGTQETMFGLAILAGARHDDQIDAIGRFLDDPFMVDVAVHEGGLGEEYLRQRGPLLAEDEVALIEAVLDERRRLWEVTAATPRESITLRDTGSGDEVTVVERGGSEGREPGELLLARVTSVGGQQMLFGVPLAIPLRERARVIRLLDGWIDADALAVWFGSLFLPPRLHNREGDELVPRRTTIEIVEDLDGAVAALDDTFDRQGDDLVWHEVTVVDGGDRVIRGVLRLDRSMLTVESNSEERQDRLIDTVDELLGAYEIVFDDVDDSDLDLDDGDGDGAGLLDPDEMPAEVRDAVAAHMAQYEERWIDESIPALDGLTPRQALDDPTRREDLFALLREMRARTAPEGAASMSADRVEKLLGIERE